MKVTKVLEKGNCGELTNRGKEACIKAVSPRTDRRRQRPQQLRQWSEAEWQTAYKAESPGEVAQRSEGLSLGDAVNAGIVQLKFAFLSGETPQAQTKRGVSPGHNTTNVAVGRPEPDRCHSISGCAAARGCVTGRTGSVRVPCDGSSWPSASQKTR
jgi:hypothetical protein